jgi:hypothetical protein
MVRAATILMLSISVASCAAAESPQAIKCNLTRTDLKHKYGTKDKTEVKNYTAIYVLDDGKHMIKWFDDKSLGLYDLCKECDIEYGRNSIKYSEFATRTPPNDQTTMTIFTLDRVKGTFSYEDGATSVAMGQRSTKIKGNCIPTAMPKLTSDKAKF